MVKLFALNSVCLKRLVARSIPSQVACRLLGNTNSPCLLDRICSKSDSKGLSFFYGVLGGILLGTLVLGFWLLRITRLSKLLGLFGRVILPPLAWVITTVVAGKRFLDSLRESF